MKEWGKHSVYTSVSFVSVNATWLGDAKAPILSSGYFLHQTWNTGSNRLYWQHQALREWVLKVWMFKQVENCVCGSKRTPHQVKLSLFQGQEFLWQLFQYLVVSVFWFLKLPVFYSGPSPCCRGSGCHLWWYVEEYFMAELYCHSAANITGSSVSTLCSFNEKEKVQCCLRSKQYLQLSLNLLLTAPYVTCRNN